MKLTITNINNGLTKEIDCNKYTIKELIQIEKFYSGLNDYTIA